MIAPLGSTATVLGLLAALVGAGAAVGAYRGRWPLIHARRASLVAAVALASANLLMVAALVANDFSVAYVAEVGSRSTPLLFTVASLWGAQKGSILFWAGLLAVLTALVVHRSRRGHGAASPVSLAVLLALVAFFAGMVVGPADPWARVSPIPADGPGPNPLLASHPLMAIHPPLLYLGFIGLAVPYAITVGALVAGRLDAQWLSLTRRWMFLPWTLLTLGLVTGAWWSYAVLGWGGYWAWDPVENVALLPWLTSTAFLHSSLVGRRAGLLAGWNVTLVVASFALTLVATVITRGGLLESVHAFTRSPIGPLFLLVLGLVLTGTIGLLLLRPPASPDGSLGPRARAFLLNNLLLVVIAATVLFGTIFPILAEALANTRVSVGAPYFERIVGPLALGLLLLVGIGPSVGNREWTADRRRPLLVGAVIGLAVATAVALAGSEPAAAIGAAVGAFVLAQSVVYLASRLQAAGQRGHRRPRMRALGGFVSHAGIGLLALALVASGAGRREANATLRTGQSTQFLGRTVALREITTTEGRPPHVLANLVLAGPDGRELVASPGLALFDQAAIALPAIVATPLTDLYLTLLDVDPSSGQATIRIGVHPFTSWLWPAGVIVALGGVMAAWPDRRRRATLASAPEPDRTPALPTASSASVSDGRSA